MKADRTLSELVGQSSKSFVSIDDVNLNNLLERIDDSSDHPVTEYFHTWY